MRRLAALLALVGALVTSGCTVGPADPLPRASAEACPAALLEGELVADDASGFLVAHEEGFVTPVIWPAGYTVREDGVRELLDPTGAVVAREGDLVSLGGGMDADDVAFIVCGPFTVTPRD